MSKLETEATSKMIQIEALVLGWVDNSIGEEEAIKQIAEVINALTPEERDLAVGAIPLQALPDPQPQQQDAPERIWMYGGPKYGRMIAYTNPARWVGSLQPVSGYTEYARVDLPRATAADAERERIIAMADALEYELPNYEQMKVVRGSVGTAGQRARSERR
jgi:hypothetical protein